MKGSGAEPPRKTGWVKHPKVDHFYLSVSQRCLWFCTHFPNFMHFHLSVRQVQRQRGSLGRGRRPVPQEFAIDSGKPSISATPTRFYTVRYNSKTGNQR